MATRRVELKVCVILGALLVVYLVHEEGTCYSDASKETNVETEENKRNANMGSWVSQ